MADLVRTLPSLSGAEYSRALDSLVYTTNRDDDTSRGLVDAGLLNVAMQLVKEANASVWNDDSAAEDNHPDWWLAFDILTNLAKWPSVRADLIGAGAVDFLSARSKQTNYFGFEATEGLAYIIGRDEDGAHSQLLQARPESVDLLIRITQAAVDSPYGSAAFFGMGFGLYGRVLALQCLSLSDANKKMLKPAIPILIAAIDRFANDPRSCDLAAKALLELSFDADNFAVILAEHKNNDALNQLVKKCDDVPELASTKKSLEALIFRLEDTKKVNAQAASSANGHVMISYNWKSQPLVKLLSAALKAAGVDVWIDFEQMQGDTIEAMASAVEKASVFVMCMTEAYKESANCRLEANYAFKHRKAMVPLMMQGDYVPSGWLGALAANNLYYELFNESMLGDVVPRVITEIRSKIGVATLNVLPSHKGVTSASPAQSPLPPVAAAASVKTGLMAPRKVSEMTVEQTAAFVKTQCNLPKLEGVARKGNVSGHALAVVLDMHLRGGPAVAVLQELGFKKAVEALEVLFQLAKIED